MLSICASENGHCLNFRVCSDRHDECFLFVFQLRSGEKATNSTCAFAIFVRGKHLIKQRIVEMNAKIKDWRSCLSTKARKLYAMEKNTEINVDMLDKRCDLFR